MANQIGLQLNRCYSKGGVLSDSPNPPVSDSCISPPPRFSGSPPPRFMFTGALVLTALLALFCQTASAQESLPPPPDTVAVSDLTLEGEINGENITFSLAFTADAKVKNAVMPLVVGDVAYLDGNLPRKVELSREGDRYLLKFASTGSRSVQCRFASRPLKDGEWRSTSFVIPASNVRKLSVICDRENLEIKFPGALDVKSQKTKDGKKQVTAFLGVTGGFEVNWKPQIKKLESELAVSCEANSIATAGVGALRTSSVFSYRIIQGAMSRMSLQLPDVINVTQVLGEDIQEWRIEKGSNGVPCLLVTLSRPKEDLYRLQVEGEMALPKFPTKFNLPVIVPEKVLRTSGFMLVGTDSAIKLQVNKSSGLSQIDQTAFPTVALDGKSARQATPQKCVYAYQFAGMPYTLEINADDIFAAYSVDDQLSLTFADNELTFAAAIQLDIKDAPAREIAIETDADPAWTVTSITGQFVSEADSDVREEDGKRIIYVPFKQAVSGAALVNIRMEKTLKPDVAGFSAPAIKVRDAKAERGYLVIAAEKGIRLKADKVAGLREVHAGPVGPRVEGVQQSYRFKEPGWSVSMTIEKTASAIHSEAFHLYSLGHGVMYSSVAITYIITGAPIQEFKLRIPAQMENIGVVAADMEGWTREGDVCTVRLQRKVMGDYTLLVTYDRQFAEQGADLSIGSVETIGNESEVGYIAIASSASLKKPQVKTRPSSFIDIDPSEIPTTYLSTVTDPILASYKYVRIPHEASVKLEPYVTEQLLGQIADYVKIRSEISKEGECVTTARYYIKNASRQFLIVSMPKDVKLWWIKYVEENGRTEDVLSQDSDKGLLIPVRRPPDPNTPLCVEIKFAQSLRDLGFWSTGFSGLGLVAPVLPDTHAAFAAWTISVQEGYSISGAAGNASASANKWRGSFFGVAVKVWRITKAFGDGWGRYTIKRALSGGIGGNRIVEFTRPVTLSGTAPLGVSVRIVPAWMGSDSSAQVFAVGLFIAFVALVMAFKSSAQKVLYFALAGTFAAVAISYSASGRSKLALLVFLALAVWLCVSIGWRLLKAFGRLLAGVFRRTKVTKEDEIEDLPFEPAPAVGTEKPGDGNEGGFTSTRILAAIAVAALLCGALSGQAAKIPVMESMKVSIEAPGAGKDAEKSAGVSATLTFKADEPVTFMILPSSCVLTDYELDSRDLEIASQPAGYMLNVKSRGKYEITLAYKTPVELKNGLWSLGIHMPENLMNRISMRLPETSLDVQSEAAVVFSAEEKKNMTEVQAVFGPVKTAVFTWRPKLRKTGLEETVFFSETSTHIGLQAGVVDMMSLIRYQIAQGEIKELKLLVPKGMAITSVRAPNLATWSFDPEKRQVDAILDRAVSGDFTLAVAAQIACDGLPYSAALGALDAVGASRQRGSLAIAAPDTIQVRVENPKGLNPMNIEDFPAGTTAAARGDAAKTREQCAIRKAFRYSQPAEVTVSVHADRILPEIRISENGALSVADERLVLATKLSVSVAKAGIFSVELGIPPEFDVDTLTGKDVSHWDEIKEGGRGVVVHFGRQITDFTEINLVIARTEKGIEQKINVPRVTVKDAAKHNGKLTIAGERGVRLMVDNHNGVDMKKTSEEGIRQAGVLVFDILRPTWSIVLKTEVLAPVVKPDVLQVVDITDGKLQCWTHLSYKIENAGVKSFRVKSPAPGVSLSVSGKNIARVTEADKEQGIWQVDLNNKVEDRYDMIAGYQIAYSPADKKVPILPFQTVNTEEQRGYVAVTCSGRVEVKPEGNPAGLKVEDARNITGDFRAGDLSGAVLCYRTLRPDYTLNLSVVRHGDAGVLSASVQHVRINSIMSPDGKLLTRVLLTMRSGHMRFLRLTLPDPSDTLWTVLVDRKEARTSRDGEVYCIPLDEQAGERDTSVDLIYAGSGGSEYLGFRQKFEAPKFEGLPLNDIEWRFFALPGVKYYAFGGTMERVEEEVEPPVAFTSETYVRNNLRIRGESIKQAKEELDKGQSLMKAGQWNVAKKAFQDAQNLSQGQTDLNEDARVQLRSLQKQQVKIGLVNRRDALRMQNNILDEQQLEQMQGFQGGNFSPEYANSIENRLSEKDNGALATVADRILDQQSAAAGVVSAINVTMPEHGNLLIFKRKVQIDPNGELSIKFRASSGRASLLFNRTWPVAALFVLCYALFASVRRKTGRNTAA